MQVVSVSSRQSEVRKPAPPRARLQLGRDWVVALLDRDADYPDLSGAPRGRVFVNRGTGELVELVAEASEPGLGSWLEIPIPEHGQRHRWFRAFLASIGCEDEYDGSIGRWLKVYGSDARFRMWSAFRAERVADHATATCRRAGIDAEIVSRSDAEADGVSLLITDDASLATACERWSAADLIGVDTEFVRERTYYPRPGLIQVADHEGVELVDPTGISDFGPLAALLTNASVTKLMHAGDEDLDVVDLLTGVTPVGVFDTQLAGAFAGYGIASSYASLVEVLLGVALDKGLTRSDWLSRPLSSAQLHYASLDVLYLAPMHERLSRELPALGRAAWFEEELQHRRRAWAVSRHPEGAYTRVKRRGKLAPPRHAVLRALSQWREVEAMARDMPRRHLLTDEVLVALASTPDLDAASLDDVEGLSPRARARYGEALLTCIDVARADGPAALDSRINLRPYADTLVRLKEIVKHEADTRTLPPELVGSRRALEALVVSVVTNGDIPLEFRGWRFDVVTQRLLECINSPN